MSGSQAGGDADQAISLLQPGSVTPWLSVIVPTYNGSKYIRQTLDSILSQGDPGIEIIAIDDGSTDETVELLNQYSGKLNLRVISRGRVGNWVANTNYGMSLAAGEYVCFLHQDDYWLPSRLKKLKSLTLSYPQAVLLLHSSYFVDKRNRVTGSWTCPFPRRTGLVSAEYVFRRLVVQNFIAIPAPIFKRQACIDAGGLDESLWYTADWKFWLKISTLGDWVYHPEPLAAFRIHEESQTISGSAAGRNHTAQMKAVLKMALPAVQQNDPLRRLARYSVHVNHSLAHYFYGGKFPARRLLMHGFSLGPIGLLRYFRYSRIVERVTARLSLT